MGVSGWMGGDYFPQNTEPEIGIENGVQKSRAETLYSDYVLDASTATLYSKNMASSETVSFTDAFAHAIRIARNRVNLTQRQLAAKSGYASHVHLQSGERQGDADSPYS